MILIKLRIPSSQLTHWIPEDWFQGNAIPEMKYKAAAELWYRAVQILACPARPQLPGTSHCKTKPPAEMRDKSQCGPVQLMETEESYTELGQISKFKPHLLYHLMVCQKVVTQSERG